MVLVRKYHKTSKNWIVKTQKCDFHILKLKLGMMKSGLPQKIIGDELSEVGLSKLASSERRHLFATL